MIRRGPTYATAWMLLAALALATPRPARADSRVSWATAQAAELVRQGDANAMRGDREVALQRYLAAINLDATYGPAYLALGRAHELGGDAREAERTYSLGIEHVTAFADGLVARGRLRVRAHRFAEAIADYDQAAELRPDDGSILEALEGALVGAGALPAALAVARRAELLAAARGDGRAVAASHVRAKALAMLVAEADPITAGGAARGPLRRALASWVTRK